MTWRGHHDAVVTLPTGAPALVWTATALVANALSAALATTLLRKSTLSDVPARSNPNVAVPLREVRLLSA
jgi:hypothetical protein